MIDFRRPISEIIARYTLVSDFKDIYVEGDFDLKFFRHIIEELNIDNIKIYSIDSINISDEDLSKFELTRGEKQELVVFSKILEEHDVSREYVLCLVDRDEDEFIGINHENKLLRYVDYNNTNSYLHKIEVFDKYLKICLNINNIDTVNTYSTIFSILKYSFILRVIKKLNNLDKSWVSITNSCRFRSKDIEFDEEGALNRFLQSQHAIQRKESISEQINELKGDPRINTELMSYNSHDFDELLKSFINSITNSLAIKNHTIISHMFLSILQMTSIKDDNIIKYIKDWSQGES